MPAHWTAGAACGDFLHRQRLSRRELLRVGGLGPLGLSLPTLLRATAAVAEPPDVTSTSGAPRGFGRARRAIVLYLNGGPAHQDTWDMKPHAPVEVRGEFAPIATAVPGTQVCELLPRTAQMLDRVALVRSVTHGDSNHTTGALPALTGHFHPRMNTTDIPPSEGDFPPFGAVVSHLRPNPLPLPDWVTMNGTMRRNNGTVIPGQFPGFLGERYSPLRIDQELTADDVEVGAVAAAEDISQVRLGARRDLLAQLDAHARLEEVSSSARSLDAYYERAFSMLISTAAREAFHLSAEPPEVRDRYGRAQFGQCCLLARRLAEAGVPMVTVYYCQTPPTSWDTHADNFRALREHLLPTFDAAYSSLVLDLEQRGLLGETLVLATAEFGRTPRVNSSSGRDHWPGVYTVTLAGGGVAGGSVYGASDAIAAYPARDAVGPGDIAATVYHLLGIDPRTTLYDHLDRPHRLYAGHTIEEILAA